MNDKLYLKNYMYDDNMTLIMNIYDKNTKSFVFKFFIDIKIGDEINIQCSIRIIDSGISNKIRS